MNLYLFQRIIGIGVLLMQITLVVVLMYLLFRKFTGKTCVVMERYLLEQRMWWIFILALVAVIGSLLFSEVYHVEACKLCWFQRAFVYPQALVAGMAAWHKDVRAYLYLKWMSLIGIVIAIYQMMAQFGVKAVPLLPCVAEPGADCAKITMLEFGYITIPVMSATFFLVVIVLTQSQKRIS